MNYSGGAHGAGRVEPHTLALIRWLASFCWAGALAGNPGSARRNPCATGGTIWCSALGMWICGARVYIGGRTTTATNIALIYSMAPVLIFGVSIVAEGARDRLQAVGVLLAFAGVLHVVLKGQWMHLADVQFVVGDLWIVGASLAWTAYSLLLKRWQSPLAVSPRLAVIALAGCVVPLLPFALFEALTGAQATPTLTGFGLSVAAALFPGYGAPGLFGHAARARRRESERGCSTWGRFMPP